MPFLEKGKSRIYFEETGSGFPLLVIPGGGLNSGFAWLARKAVFNAINEFKSEYRVVAMDLRTSNAGQSTGPLEANRPWDAYTEDQLGLLDHLGIDRFMVLGYCIGNPLIWNLLKHAPQRVVAAVSAQPSGIDPKDPESRYHANLTKWAPKFVASRPGVTMDMAEKFLASIFKNADFVMTVTRDFVRNCATPLLVLPDDSKQHPYVTAMEMVSLAPNAQVSLFPWKDTRENMGLAVRHVRTFLKAHCPQA